MFENIYTTCHANECGGLPSHHHVCVSCVKARSRSKLNIAIYDDPAYIQIIHSMRSYIVFEEAFIVLSVTLERRKKNPRAECQRYRISFNAGAKIFVGTVFFLFFFSSSSLPIYACVNKSCNIIISRARARIRSMAWEFAKNICSRMFVFAVIAKHSLWAHVVTACLIA